VKINGKGNELILRQTTLRHVNSVKDTETLDLRECEFTKKEKCDFQIKIKNRVLQFEAPDIEDRDNWIDMLQRTKDNLFNSMSENEKQRKGSKRKNNQRKSSRKNNIRKSPYIKPRKIKALEHPIQKDVLKKKIAKILGVSQMEAICTILKKDLKNGTELANAILALVQVMRNEQREMEKNYQVKSKRTIDVEKQKKEQEKERIRKWKDEAERKKREDERKKKEEEERKKKEQEEKRKKQAERQRKAEETRKKKEEDERKKKEQQEIQKKEGSKKKDNDKVKQVDDSLINLDGLSNIKSIYEKEPIWAQVSMLVVEVAEARNLKKMDLNGFADPYLKILFIDSNGNEKLLRTTPVIKKNLNPVFGVKEIIRQEFLKIDGHLKIEVWDHDRLSHDDFMGQVCWNITMLMNDGIEGWSKLVPRKKGTGRNDLGELRVNIQSTDESKWEWMVKARGLICMGCNETFPEGYAVNLIVGLYHPKCLKCANPECETPIDASGPTQQFLETSKGVWHNECIVCTTCGKKIDVNKDYREEPTGIYHTDCPSKKTGVPCGACPKPICGDFMEIKGVKFHSYCFKCMKCEKDLNGKKTLVKSKKIYCSKRCWRAYSIS